MSEFATTLTDAITATKVSLREVSRTCEVDSSLLSRLCAGNLGPSSAVLKTLVAKLNPQIFEHLTSDHGPQLQLAYLRDCAQEVGVDLSTLRLSFAAAPEDSWWDSLDPVLAARLRNLGIAAKEDKEFSEVLKDLEPLGLKLQAAKIDSQKLEALVQGRVYAFPKGKTLHVADPKPLPRGKSQQPTA